MFLLNGELPANPARQAQFFRAILAILCVALSVVGWFRWVFVWLIVTLLTPTATGQARASQEPLVWKDPSPHSVQFVTVENDVQLEVLNWGGRGRPIVLLAGSGNSAHVFDDFAPKLTDAGHVYGVTRRGYGASSQPAAGYDNQRLADDILSVLDALKIETPILAGHSMAGGEMTTLGHQHSSRLGGLVFLDALSDPADDPALDPAWVALQQKLPPSAPPPVCPQDRTSFRAYGAWLQCSMGFTFPESEFRSTYDTNADGSVGRYKTPQRVNAAVGAGQVKRDYSNIRVPVLALFEFRRTSLNQLRRGDPEPRNDEERAAVLEFLSAGKPFFDRWVGNLTRNVPDVRVVDLPAAGHYVFLTKETEVIREVRAFALGLR